MPVIHTITLRFEEDPDISNSPANWAWQTLIDHPTPVEVTDHWTYTLEA